MTRDSLFYIDKKASGSLKSRLRETIVNAILNGDLELDNPLPSSRVFCQTIRDLS